MTVSKRVAVLLVLFGALGAEAAAQTSRPLAAGDVAGDWSLAITPVSRNGIDISVESRDGGPSDWPLTIASVGGNRLSCVIRDRPGECRIENGALVLVSPSRSGGASMTFNLAERTTDGLRGTARMRVRLMPFVGGQIGTVMMTRR